MFLQHCFNTLLAYNILPSYKIYSTLTVTCNTVFLGTGPLPSATLAVLLGYNAPRRPVLQKGVVSFSGLQYCFLLNIML